MTIQVVVKHDNEGYERNIRVFYVNDKGEPINPHGTKILVGGESAKFLVYKNQNLRVEEV